MGWMAFANEENSEGELNQLCGECRKPQYLLLVLHLSYHLIPSTKLLALEIYWISVCRTRTNTLILSAPSYVGSSVPVWRFLATQLFLLEYTGAITKMLKATKVNEVDVLNTCNLKH